MKSGITHLLETDFDWWSNVKERVNSKQPIPGFRAGQIWWIHLGLNVGSESRGTGIKLLRPVLILTRYNNQSFLSVPLTTSPKRNAYRISIGKVDNKDAAINISQLRYTDSKRLFKKIGELDPILLTDLKRKASEINFR